MFLEREDGWFVGQRKLGQRCWRNVVQANPVHSHVARNILELLLAHVLESKVKPSADLFTNFAGNTYPAGVSCVTNASSEQRSCPVARVCRVINAALTIESILQWWPCSFVTLH
jgi:hypothetical protein